MRPSPVLVTLMLSASAALADGTASPGAFSAPPRLPARAALPDSTRVGLLARRWSPMETHLQLAYPGATRSGHASPHDVLGLSPKTRPLTTLERLAYGADKGAFAGLALGTLGDWAGAWEEKTAWALMGAGAALGALWGGIGDDDSRIRIRPSISVSPDDER